MKEDMRKIFVLERMVALGVWELMSDTFYTDEREALDVSIDVMKKGQEYDKNFAVRVTKMVNNKIKEKRWKQQN